MRILIAVDHSSHSEQIIDSLVKGLLPKTCCVRLLMVINPFTPPPATTVLDGLEHFQFVMRYKAHSRVDDLAQRLKLQSVSVETDVCESRLPPSIATVLSAVRWRADELIAGVHSLIGFKRYLLLTVFNILNRNTRRMPPSNRPGRDPSAGQNFTRKKAA